MFHVEHNKRISVKDYLVSGEHFDVAWISRNMAQTLPQPKAEELPAYYASEAYISHQKTKRSLIDILYHVSRRWMMRRKEAWISPYLNPHARILDFGCGTGAFIEHLDQRKYQAHGVEPSRAARENAAKHLSIYTSIKETKGDFQLISLWHVLEHLPDPSGTLSQLDQKLSSNGHLLLALPNFNSWDAKHYGPLWAAWDVPRHLWHFSPEGVVSLMSTLDYELVQKKAMPLDAFYISYLSEKHKKSVFPFFKGILKGMYSNLMGIMTSQYSSQLYVFKRKG